MKKIFCIALILAGVFVCKAQEDAITQLEQGAAEQRQQQQQESSGNQSSMDAALGGLNQFFRIMSSVDDLYASSNSLAGGECSPDFSTSNQAMMPSTCGGNPKCNECYTSATNELNFVRRQLARLSCIYNNTKNFNQSAIAFGDNASGIHAVTGLAWQYARADIVATFNHFKTTYDNKYQGLMGSLEKALKAIGECEQQYGQPDWYQRFGFIYFEFMKDKYRRTD
ncbi:MAG: hypothetical protein JST17_04100 [Bacteroidetes bacterium]|nr:hypothetical protein [Bacteroidota bacterium]MBS1929591.1 hypothetical protein [Bacteroidota bacterium]